MFSIFLNIFSNRGNTERYDDTVIRLTVTVYGYSYYSYYNLQSMHDDKRDSIRSRAAITGEVLLLLKRNEAAQLCGRERRIELVSIVINIRMFCSTHSVVAATRRRRHRPQLAASWARECARAEPGCVRRPCGRRASERAGRAWAGSWCRVAARAEAAE